MKKWVGSKYQNMLDIIYVRVRPLISLLDQDFGVCSYLCQDPGVLRDLNGLREKVRGHVVADLDRPLRRLNEAIQSVKLQSHPDLKTKNQIT